MARLRTRLDVNARRAQVLDSTLTLFCARPSDEPSMGEIAEFCGVSRALLYHYFGSKRELYLAAVQHGAQKLAAFEPEPSLAPGDRLRSGLRAFFEDVQRFPVEYEALRRMAANDPEVALVTQQTKDVFAARVIDGIPGADQSVLGRAVVHAWVGSVEVAALNWIAQRDPPVDQLVEVLAVALRGAILAAAEIDDSIRPDTS